MRYVDVVYGGRGEAVVELLAIEPANVVGQVPEGELYSRNTRERFFAVSCYIIG